MNCVSKSSNSVSIDLKTRHRFNRTAKLVISKKMCKVDAKITVGWRGPIEKEEQLLSWSALIRPSRFYSRVANLTQHILNEAENCKRMNLGQTEHATRQTQAFPENPAC